MGDKLWAAVWAILLFALRGMDKKRQTKVFNVCFFSDGRRRLKFFDARRNCGKSGWEDCGRLSLSIYIYTHTHVFFEGTCLFVGFKGTPPETTLV